MTKPVINIDDVELESRPAAFSATGPAAERFDAKMGVIGPRIGAQKLWIQHHRRTSRQTGVPLTQSPNK